MCLKLIVLLNHLFKLSSFPFTKLCDFIIGYKWLSGKHLSKYFLKIRQNRRYYQLLDTTWFKPKVTTPTPLFSIMSYPNRSCLLYLFITNKQQWLLAKHYRQYSSYLRSLGSRFCVASRSNMYCSDECRGCVSCSSALWPMVNSCAGRPVSHITWHTHYMLTTLIICYTLVVTCA